jgi:parvulin-like peptidyl-prolyl isomerase
MSLEPALQPAVGLELHPGSSTLSLAQLQRLMRLQGLDRSVALALVLDEVVSAIELPEAEIEQLLADWQAADGAGHVSLSPEEERYLATRQRKLELFQQRAFGADVELRFLDRKLELDQVVYSLIRVDDEDAALELYQRLVEGEADFADLAPEFSLGPERESGGRLGPHSLMASHPELSARFRVSQPGQLWEPFFVVDIWVILRVEEVIAAELDAAMRRNLIAEVYNEWMINRVDQVLRGDPTGALPLPRDR